MTLTKPEQTITHTCQSILCHDDHHLVDKEDRRGNKHILYQDMMMERKEGGQ